jgi:ribosomal protein S19E (S16A)
MAIGLESGTVATKRPKGRPKRSERDDGTTKIDRTILSRLKAVASYRGVPVAELLSELVRAPLDKAYAQVLRDLEKDQEKG